jgi:hypothetical protein
VLGDRVVVGRIFKANAVADRQLVVGETLMDIAGLLPPPIRIAGSC